MTEAGQHTPVLVRAVCELLAISPGDTVVDATIGLGGHAARFAEALSASGVLVGLDVDAGNLSAAEARLADFAENVVLCRRNFRELPEALRDARRGRADVIFADLGVSSPHLDNPERGFSFAADGPLDMRLDDRLTTTAADLVNQLREGELADLIYHNGQEHRSRRIASRICAVRRERRITRTSQLAEVVAAALRVDPKSRRSKIHPATRTFQALRISVNDELGALDALLECAPDCLNPGGRIGIISFHSLEDGRVKRAFLQGKREGVLAIATKKPVVADQDERKENPRSRSAKLRVAVRTQAEIDTA